MAMAMLNLSKVAVGCGDLAALAGRIAARAEGGEVAITTRYRPTRHEEVIGGSLFWIVRHQFIARQRIIGFGQTDNGARTLIRLEADLVVVTPQSRRAHQGWRYLAGEDAPADLASDPTGLSSLPPALLGELAALALV
jgi:hypothetical protein